MPVKNGFSFRRVALLIAGTAAFLRTAPISAQTSDPPPPAAAKKLSDDLQLNVIAPTAGIRKIRVTVDHSVLVETNKPTSRVQSVSPQVAFVQSVSPKQVLISGVSYGTTHVLLWSEDDQQEVIEVDVALDLDGLRTALSQIEPGNQAQVTGVKNHILLTGTVSGVDAIRRMEEVALLFVPEDGQVRNQLRTSDAALNQALKAVDPQGRVQAQTVGGRIILTGSASGPKAVERMMDVAGLYVPPTVPGTSQGAGTQNPVANHMTIPGEQQVMLRCTVAEVSRAATRELGINGFLAGENFRDAFVVSQIGGIAAQNIGVPEASLVTQNMPFVVGTDGIPIPQSATLSLGFPRVQMQAFLKAMSDNTLLRVLAEPNLVAISGESAGFLAGGEFPVPVPQGVDQITVEYKPFGVSLQFTPAVLDGELIRLKIAPEVSEIDFASGVQLQGFSVPGVRVRRAETTVEIGAGQTIAIAGLLDEQSRGVATKLPGIGELPVLGALFSSVQYQRSQTELVILVTPELVAPMNPDQVPSVPGEHLLHPSDVELYALGLLEGIDNRKAAAVQTREESEPSMAPVAAPASAVIGTTQPELLSIHGPWGSEGTSEGQG